MDEPDFITRQHLESLNPSNDPSVFELLNRYKFPPSEPKQQAPSQFQGAFPVPVQNNDTNAVMLGHMMGQLQGTLQNQDKKSTFDGISLNINSDVMRWIILLLFLALLAVVVFVVFNRGKETKSSKRLRKLEKQLKKLNNYSRGKKNKKRKKRKNPALLEEDEDDYLALGSESEADDSEADDLEDDD